MVETVPGGWRTHQDNATVDVVAEAGSPSTSANEGQPIIQSPCRCKYTKLNGTIKLRMMKREIVMLQNETLLMIEMINFSWCVSGTLVAFIKYCNNGLSMVNIVFLNSLLQLIYVHLNLQCHIALFNFVK